MSLINSKLQPPSSHISLKAAAKRLHMPYITLWRWNKIGKIKAVKRGSYWYLSKEEFKFCYIILNRKD